MNVKSPSLALLIGLATCQTVLCPDFPAPAVATSAQQACQQKPKDQTLPKKKKKMDFTGPARPSLRKAPARTPPLSTTPQLTVQPATSAPTSAPSGADKPPK